MRKINEAQHAINHRVTQRDQRINRSQPEPIDDLLEIPIQEAR